MIRRIFLLGLLVIGGCFEGGFDRTGFPCTADLDCGDLQCLGGVCGGPTTGPGTTTGSGVGDDGTPSGSGGTGSSDGGGTSTDGTSGSATGSSQGSTSEATTATGSSDTATATSTTGPGTTTTSAATTTSGAGTTTTGTATATGSTTSGGGSGTTTTTTPGMTTTGGGTTTTTTTTAPQPNYVFITDTNVAPGDLGGLQGADDMCNTQAGAAGLPGNYVAWLSTTGVNAEARLAGARGWVRPDGLPFVDRVTDLTVGQIWYPARLAADGTDQSSTVVTTGTSEIGQLALGTCGEWMDNTSPDNVIMGSGDAGHLRWTNNLPGFCNDPARIYCFGVDNNVQVNATGVAGRLAFISKDPFEPAPGLTITAADTQCQTEATMSGETGTFKALLATDVDSAISRFSRTGQAWVRPDGIPLTLDPADLGFEIEAPLYQMLDGTRVGGRMIWAGAGFVEGTAPGSTCGDWTTTAGNAWASHASRTNASWFGSVAVHPCSDTSTYLYCFEE